MGGLGQGSAGAGGSLLISTRAQGGFAAGGRGSWLRAAVLGAALRLGLHPRAFADSFEAEPASEHPNTAGGIASSVPALGGPPAPRGLARGGTSASPAQRPSCQLGMNPWGTDVGNRSAGPRASDGCSWSGAKLCWNWSWGTGVCVSCKAVIVTPGLFGGVVGRGHPAPALTCHIEIPNGCTPSRELTAQQPVLWEWTRGLRRTQSRLQRGKPAVLPVGRAGRSGAGGGASTEWCLGMLVGTKVWGSTAGAREPRKGCGGLKEEVKEEVMGLAGRWVLGWQREVFVHRERLVLRGGVRAGCR